MFGKAKRSMTQASKFVMAQGKKVGNIRPPMKMDSVSQTSAVENMAGQKGRTNLGAMGKVKT